MVKYFTEVEISLHKNPEDCWVSIFDSVYNLSDLIKENRGVLAHPLINAAGTSISHWFNEKTGDVKTYIDPVRNIEMPYTPYGRFIHVPPEDPIDNVEAVSFPWWKDRRYVIGKVRQPKYTFFDFSYFFIYLANKKDLEGKNYQYAHEERANHSSLPRRNDK